VYAIGQGVPEDQSQANYFYAKACNSGDHNGCTALALQYEFGEGTDKNMQRATQLWNKACRMGDELACAEAAKLQ
jgi:TPR repeat protein